MIVESVGLGQSEVEIDQAVDMLVVLVPPGILSTLTNRNPLPNYDIET